MHHPTEKIAHTTAFIIPVVTGEKPPNFNSVVFNYSSALCDKPTTVMCKCSVRQTGQCIRSSSCEALVGAGS